MKHTTMALLYAMMMFLVSACGARQNSTAAPLTTTANPLLATVAVPTAAAPSEPGATLPPPSPDSQAGIGYSTVDEALKDLSSKPGAQVKVQDGWTIITEDKGLTMWTFVPANHPAYPSVVKRVLSEQGGAWYVTMNVLCGAPEAACQKLVADFQALNDRMRQAMEGTQTAP